MSREKMQAVPEPAVPPELYASFYHDYRLLVPLRLLTPLLEVIAQCTSINYEYVDNRRVYHRTKRGLEDNAHVELVDIATVAEIFLSEAK